MQKIPLGVLVADDLHQSLPRFMTYGGHLADVLLQAGLCHKQLHSDDLNALPDSGLKILITAGDLKLSTNQQQSLEAFLMDGGTWISIAGLSAANSLLGVEPIAPSFQGGWGSPVMTSLGEHYLAINDDEHGLLSHIHQPLHGFGGLAVRATTARVLAMTTDAHGRPTDRVGISCNEVGEGQAIYFATDLPGSLIHIQQGIAVTRDGISDPLGNATVADGILKADDGRTLDWDLDRQPVPGCDGLYGFLEPVADLWRVTLIRLILDSAVKIKLSLPVLWYWPDKLPGVGHLSFDSDGNDPTLAKRLLEICAQADVATTWCVICPGYDRQLIEEIHHAGHELAMHYDAMSPNKPWSREQFENQHAELVELFDGRRPISNKNHYFRWEGDCDFYRWLESVGIELDQSKGSSKTGEFGFAFGTCHPYFPIDEQGRRMNVLELPTPTMDLPLFVPLVASDAMLDSVIHVHGVYHLLFHPGQLDKPGVCDAFLAAVSQGKQAGLQWWTASQINHWLRTRATARWVESAQGLSVFTSRPLKNATLLTLMLPGDEANEASLVDRADTTTFTCWGYRFHARVITPAVAD